MPTLAIANTASLTVMMEKGLDCIKMKLHNTRQLTYDTLKPHRLHLTLITLHSSCLSPGDKQCKTLRPGSHAHQRAVNEEYHMKTGVSNYRSTVYQTHVCRRNASPVQMGTSPRTALQTACFNSHVCWLRRCVCSVQQIWCSIIRFM